MTTLVIQTAAGVLLLAVGVTAWLISRALPSSDRYSAGWRIAGVVYSFYTVVFFVHAVFAVIAFIAGVGSGPFEAFISFSSVANHGRTGLLASYYLLFWALLVNAAWVRRADFLAAIGVAGFSVGALYGLLEGPLIDFATHFSATMMADTVLVVILAILLYLLLVTDHVDRYLWMFIALLGFKSAIGVIYIAALSWFHSPGVWTPPVWHLHLFRAVINAVVLILLLKRLRLARNGVPVSGILPTFRSRIVIGR